MFDGVPGSGEKLKAAVKGNDDYSGELIVLARKADPNKFNLQIPDKVIKSKDSLGEEIIKTIQGRTVTFDKNNPDDKIALNQLINDITKENVNISQLMTEGGKKKVENGKGVDAINKPGKTNKKAQRGYKIGQVDGGYKYTGGDPANQENWIKQ